MKKFLPIFFITFVFLFLFSIPIKVDAVRLDNLRVLYRYNEIGCMGSTFSCTPSNVVWCTTAAQNLLVREYPAFSDVGCGYVDCWTSSPSNAAAFSCSVTIEPQANFLLPYYYNTPLHPAFATQAQQENYAKTRMMALLPQPPVTINNCTRTNNYQARFAWLYQFQCSADISVPPPTGGGTGGGGTGGGGTGVPALPLPPNIVCDESNGGRSGLVPCGRAMSGNTVTCPCQFYHFFILIKNVYIFILWYIATPLAALLIVLGGLFLMLSGASPKLHDTGKQMLWGAAWGIALIFGAYLIVSSIMMALGYQDAWNVFPAF